MSQQMNENNFIQLLPNEILEQILSSDVISYCDLCGICCVSKRFNQLIVNNNEIWKKKFIQKWSDLSRNKYFRVDLQSLRSDYWHKVVVERHRIGSHVRREVNKLSENHYFDDELSNDSFKPFIHLNQSKDWQQIEDNIRLFQINELEIILNDGMSHKNLTIKYYALKVLRYLRHQLIKDQWIQYLESNDNSDLDLFDGALLISNWFQSNDSLNEEHFRKQIQLMAQLTIHEIGLKYPNNSLIKLNLSQCLTDLEANHLSESKWSSDDCKQILLSLNEVLFNQLRFGGNNTNYYSTCNSFIDKVIDNRLGIPITLCILYQTIAAKLGVKTYAVNFPQHFLIKWKNFESESESDKYTYIDVYENGRFLNSNSSIFQNYIFSDIESLGVCQPIDVFRRMCRNLIEIGRQQEISSEGLLCLRNALELLCILSPEETEPRLLLSRVYLHLNINLEEVDEMLQQISEKDPTSIGVVMFLRQNVKSQLSAKRAANNNMRRNNITVREKNNNILYSIGMIMSHIKYNYTCVIYGWDSKCAASRDWIYQMGVYNLPNKDKQPFYNVLVEDGSTRYAAQENLMPCPQPIQIRHPEVGKYFKEFAITHYLPNDQKAVEYPDDESATNDFLLSQQNI